VREEASLNCSSQPEDVDFERSKSLDAIFDCELDRNRYMVAHTRIGATESDQAANKMADPFNAVHESAPPTVRLAWLTQVVAQTQFLAGRLAVADRDESAESLDAFAASLPVCIGPLEAAMLRKIVMDVAYKGGRAIHQRLHTDKPATCPFSPAGLLDPFWYGDPADVRHQFDQWRLGFFLEFNRTHPPTLASSIGRLVKREFRKPWRLRSLARRFHTTPTTIRRSFTREFGFSVGEYRTRARLVAALGAIPREKVEAVALLVGYKSKKSFYQAFSRLVGITPGEFKKLPAERALDVQAKAAARLLRPPSPERIGGARPETPRPPGSLR
jgi:AraC-like DNA-binding protein